MTPMILGNNEEKIVNYSIRVIHQEDNKVKVVVVDKNNGDKVEGVIASDVPTGRYVECDLSARLYVEHSEPARIENLADVRKVELKSMSNSLDDDSTLLIFSDSKPSDIWIHLNAGKRALVAKMCSIIAGDIKQVVISSTRDICKSYTLSSGGRNDLWHLHDSMSGDIFEFEYIVDEELFRRLKHNEL